MAISVTIDQFRHIIEDLPRDLDKAVIRGLRSAGRQLERFFVEEITAAGAVDTGDLRNSVDYTSVSDGAVVSVDAPHAAPIDQGTRPFRPPTAPLAAWALRKGLAANQKEAESIAFAIANTLAEKGITPRHYSSKAFRRVLPVIGKEIDREIKRMRKT